MHWLEEWRTAHQMSQKTLALQVGVSEQLIWNIENGKGYGFTQPLIANDIADYTGATIAQRDSIVAKKHRGTYVPNPKKKGKPIQKPRTEAENLPPQRCRVRRVKRCQPTFPPRQQFYKSP